MRVLLDTQIFLWAVLDPGKLPSSLRGLNEDSETDWVISAASAWEIATKLRLGKLPGAAHLVRHFDKAVDALYAEQLPVTALRALKAGGWEIPHRDPFHRMLAAQAVVVSLTLATTDPALRAVGPD
jgi:PIN domain nuclease of toxin-antitoxin system